MSTKESEISMQGRKLNQDKLKEQFERNKKLDEKEKWKGERNSFLMYRETDLATNQARKVVQRNVVKRRGDVKQKEPNK